MELHNYIVWRWAIVETSRDLLKNIRRVLRTLVFQSCQMNVFAIPILSSSARMQS